MAAVLLEDVNEEFDESSLESGEELQQLDGESETPVEDIVEEEEVEVEEDELPEQYRGKSVSDIVRMHQEAEKLVGRQGTEVGELRKLVDDYVKPAQKDTSVQEEDVEIDFFDNPQEAVNRAISSNPALKEVQTLTQDLKKQKIGAQLATNHPDYMETINNEDFANWVKGSKFRMELYQRADGNFDYESADELLTTWKERTQAVAQTKVEAKEDVKAQRKAASTGTSRGTSETSSRKIYRRSDIMNLMRNDPDRYLELSDEILKAYAEKRVR